MLADVVILRTFADHVLEESQLTDLVCSVERAIHSVRVVPVCHNPQLFHFCLLNIDSLQSELASLLPHAHGIERCVRFLECQRYTGRHSLPVLQEPCAR